MHASLLRVALLSLTLAVTSSATSIAPVPTAAPGAPLTVVVCGGDLFPKSPNFEAHLRTLKSLGFTSVQTYIYWNLVEKSPGVYDWSDYDAEVAIYQRVGLKWVPFIVMSPWYTTPEFIRQTPGMKMLRCLDHQRDSKIPSIWSPELRTQLRTYLGKFAERYRPLGVLESVNIGISGDYGEAIYPVIGNWPGAYHSHAGYWCGDELAAADFRRHTAATYGNQIAALNAAWKTSFTSFEQINPFLPQRAPSERAWQEMLSWYRGAMTHYADWCMGLTRELFPDSPIYLCTGGDMAPAHGSDFVAQAQVAAKHQGGIRITNEGSSYPMNVRYTRLVASACRQYGAYFGHEPASLVTPPGMVGRIFNAITSGANQLFAYDNSELADAKLGKVGPMGDFLRNYQSLLRHHTPLIETAVYHPNLSAEQMKSEEGARISMFKLGELFADLRRFIDYDMVDDAMLRDGALDSKKILIVAGTEVMPSESMRRIEDWVRGGGVAFFLASRPVSWAGDTHEIDRLLGFTPQTDTIDGLSVLGNLIPRPDILPSIAELKDVVFTRGYTPVAADCEVLLAMSYGPQAKVAWRRKIGAGTVYAYFGPMDLKQDEASWIVSQRLPLRFMRDTLESAVRDKIVPAAPASLHLDRTEVFKVQTTAGLWLLNMADTEATVEVVGRKVTLPAHSITPPASP